MSASRSGRQSLIKQGPNLTVGLLQPTQSERLATRSCRFQHTICRPLHVLPSMMSMDVVLVGGVRNECKGNQTLGVAVALSGVFSWDPYFSALSDSGNEMIRLETAPNTVTANAQIRNLGIFTKSARCVITNLQSRSHHGHNQELEICNYL